MAETASRVALENALTSYALQDRQQQTRAFLDALAVDEMLFLAEFLGGCIAAGGEQYRRRADRMLAAPSGDLDHKLILLTEFADHCGLTVKLVG